MTAKFRRIIVFIILILVVSVCVALPTISIKARDLRYINTVNMTEIEPIRLDNNQVSLAKRISLINSKIYKGDVQILGLDSGLKLTLNTAIENVKAQIDILYNIGLLPENSQAYMSTDEMQLFIGGIEFAVDNEDPSCNLILWDIEAISNDFSVSLKMDDETGKILMYSVQSENITKWSESVGFNTASKKWSDYLGLDLSDDYKLLYGSKAKIYLQMNDNIFLDSEIYDFNKISDEIPRILHMNLFDGQDMVSYILYKDIYEFGMAVE